MRSAAINSLKRLGRKYRLEQALVRDLGRYNIRRPVGRCLISYYSTFIRYLNEHPEIGQRGWNLTKLPEKMERLSLPFSWHTMNWESAEMVRQFIERGFIVDCIYDRDSPLMEQVAGYDVIVEEWNNLELWHARNPAARKLYYATGSHWIYHNAAELQRHAWLMARRGVVVPTMRQVPAIMGLENAQLISFFGNRANANTYGPYAGKLRKLWLTAVNIPSEFPSRRWGEANKRFLWFGGRGWVHKGLDLTIEAFLKEPQLELVIVGSDLDSDAYFWRIYGDSIKKSNNIQFVGRLDPVDPRFEELMSSTIAVVVPSAAENGGGAIVQCLHFGLLPLVTEITGLEIHNVWTPLAGRTDQELIQDIRDRCNEIACMPSSQLLEWSQFFWEYAHQNHTRRAYSQSFANLLDELLA